MAARSPLRASASLSVMILAILIALRTSAQAQTYKVVYLFGTDDAWQPAAPPMMDQAGNLYGTTASGGQLNCDAGRGCGVIYKLSNQEFTILHEFDGTTVAHSGDGDLPEAGVIYDSAGNLYGTTLFGGNGCGVPGCGTVFKLGTEGQLSLLHSFVGGPNDGSAPMAPLYRDAAGNLFGTTENGGVQSVLGTVFMLNPAGQETILHFFTQSPDGAFPHSGLISDSAGNLYGATAAGGSANGNCVGVGCGTVYKMTSNSGSWTESVIYTFLGGQDGFQPAGGLLQDSSGNLYGVTAGGGGSTNCGPFGCGTIFKLSPSSSGWTETILYRFTGSSNGASPTGSLVEDSAGNLYGVTIGGGGRICNCGVVFRLDPAGNYGILHTFTTAPGDGNGPNGLLLDESTSSLYGTTAGGGDAACSPNGCGVVFKIKL